MFEWQKHSQETITVPHYNELLDFINLRAQTSELLPIALKESNPSSIKKKTFPHKPIASFAANTSDLSTICIVFKTKKHPLYAYPRFKLLPHEKNSVH